MERNPPAFPSQAHLPVAANIWGPASSHLVLEVVEDFGVPV